MASDTNPLFPITTGKWRCPRLVPFFSVVAPFSSSFPIPRLQYAFVVCPFIFLFFHSFVVTALLCIPRAKRVVAIHQSDNYALSSFLFNLNLISLKKERKKKSDFFSPFDLYLNKLHNTRYLHANVIVYLMNSVKCRAPGGRFGESPGFCVSLK